MVYAGGFERLLPYIAIYRGSSGCCYISLYIAIYRLHLCGSSYIVEPQSQTAGSACKAVHTSAYVSIRKHTSAYVSKREPQRQFVQSLQSQTQRLPYSPYFAIYRYISLYIGSSSTSAAVRAKSSVSNSTPAILAAASVNLLRGLVSAASTDIYLVRVRPTQTRRLREPAQRFS